MLKLSFNRRWVQAVMNCDTALKYQIKVNGDAIEIIIPERRLCQGDPLSPYPFLLCVEGFSATLQNAEANGRIKICRTSPSISHLVFVNDSLLLLEANANSAHELNQILNAYEACSGRAINKEKTTILFSKNTKGEDKEDLMNQLNIATEGFYEKYLGLPW